jgi:preprotein translocase subunit SecF
VEFIKNWLDKLEIDFVGRRYVAGSVSLILVIASWVLFFGVGPNWGIDFTGGTEIHIKFSPGDGQPDLTSIMEVREALRTMGLGDDAVQSVGSTEDNEFAIRIQDATFGIAELQAEVEQSLVAAFGPDWIQEIASDAEVGARFVVSTVDEVADRKAVAAAVKGIPGLSVQDGKDEGMFVITASGLANQIQERIGEAMGGRPFEVLAIDAVGPKVGGELRRQGFVSIAATLGLVLIYVAFRFDIGFAPGAVLALFHDVSLTVGIFVLAQLEFNLPMIGALLTIVGYSLNDTIVIYDRIRENRDRYRRGDLAEMINVSINETLTRTVATSVTTVLAITMLILIGGPVIRNFAFAMFLGIIFGTYSTVFVASPMILVMEDVKPWLSRLIVSTTPATGGESGPTGRPTTPATTPPPDDEDADTEDESTLTEAEKRRRARAAAERGQTPL